MQIDLTEDGFTIGRTDSEVPVLGRCQCVTVSLISGVLASLIEQLKILNQTIGERLAHPFPHSTGEAQRNIPTIVVQTAIELQPSPCTLRVTIRNGIIDIPILHNTQVYQFLHRIIIKRIPYGFIRILVESGRIALAQPVTGVIAELRPHHDIGH